MFVAEIGCVGDELKRPGLEAVTDQDRRGLVVGFVQGGLAPAQVVVVHGGEVVVDQGVGVDQFDGASHWIQASIAIIAS